MSVREEIVAFLKDNPNATPEEIGRALALTKIEVLGHLTVLSANIPARTSPLRAEALVVEAEIAPATFGEPIPADLVGPPGWQMWTDSAHPPLTIKVEEVVTPAGITFIPIPVEDFAPVPADLAPVFPPASSHLSPTGNGWDASDITALFNSGAVMDIYTAAEYLGVQRNSIEYAVLRGSLICAEIRGKKLFGRVDLDAYAAKRGNGRASKLTKSA